MGLILVEGASGTAQAADLRVCSPDWTRTSNPAINSRMLCQLSYGGPAAGGGGMSEYPIASTPADGRVGSR